MMATTVAAEKARIREEVRRRLEKVSGRHRADDGVRACELLARQSVWREAASVLLYAPTKDELDVWCLGELALRQGKLLALPLYESSNDCYGARQIEDLQQDLTMGRYGIREPKSSCNAIALKQLDLTLVPGVAFDLRGRRLGRGKGYYDRVLAAMRGQTCGVAFDEQIVLQVPVEPHDLDVNWILTPTRWIEL
jgi:5-formyltetrahydrofolate cyclo-ligase